MVTVILEVQLWPNGRKHDEVYFCKEVKLPFLPNPGLEYMLRLNLGGDNYNQFNVKWVQWHEDKGHALVRLELSKFCDNVPEEAFAPSTWQRGTYYATFE